MTTRNWSIIVLAVLIAACSGGSEKKEDQAGEDSMTEVKADSESPDVTGEVTDVLVEVTPDMVDTVDDSVDVTDDLAVWDTDSDGTEVEVVGEPFVELEESIVGEASPGCPDCYIIQYDSWDGSWDPAGPQNGQYDFPWTDDQGTDWIFYFRPWMRMRMPHPGTVKRLLLYTAGGEGAIQVQVSTGFPGGHYPCLDEMSGDDLYPVGKPFRVPISGEPGWREVDVSSLNHTLLGYDEFFIIWKHEDETRVGLSTPTEVFPGDYKTYGGLIADAPGDGMACFSSMDNFIDPEENPLVWLVRAEIDASEVTDTKTFIDPLSESPVAGGHVAFGDYDNDGDDDFLSSGNLWQNDGTGQFENVSEAVGLAGSGLGGETVWGDYNNDGHRDILGIGGFGKLMMNNGDQTFTDVTETSGISLDANSQGVAWLDIDGDGYLDFYAASYGTQADGEKATRDFVYYNNGDGTFSDVTEDFGVPVTPVYYHGRGLCVADYDGDGDADVYVGNYRLDPNQLWQNQGGMKGFEDVAWDAGVKGNFVSGAWGHAIGPSWGEFNGDGLMDLIVPNLDHPRFYSFSDPTILYLNNGDGTFMGLESQPFEPSTSGILYDETHSNSTVFDFDNDGDHDLFLTSVYEGRRSYLYANDGSGVFTDVTYTAGIRHFNGWGSAAADVDGDGDQDLMAHHLLFNQAVEQGAVNYLVVRLVGGASVDVTEGFSNRDAIGALATLTVGSQTIVRQVEGGTGVGCQNGRDLHFGMGTAGSASSLGILWPSGKQTTITSGLDAGQVLVVNE